jgi:hypothetical protein
MSSLTPEELRILTIFRSQIQYAPTRETLMKYHKYKYDPFSQYTQIKKKDNEIKKKKDDGYEVLGHGYKGFMMAHLLKPSHSGLTVDELERAQLSRASREFYEQGVGAAEQYLMQKDNPYKIDTELSNNEALVVVNKEGKPEMAFRGTDKANFEDLKTDAAILFGKEADTEQFKNADDLIQKVNEKYGMLPEHYSGFSLGGAKSLHFGQKYNTPTTNFNPFMGKNLTKNIQNTSALQKVVRTVNDPASIGLALSDEATHPSWRVKSILPLKKNTLNPIATHHLDNLTNDDNLERTNDNMLNYQVKSINYGMKLAEYGDLNTAIEAVNSGKSYAQWLYEDQTSYGDSFLRDDGTYGLKGPRHIPSSRGIRAWHDAGGEFNEAEATRINKLMKGIIPDEEGLTNTKLGVTSGGSQQSVPIDATSIPIPPFSDVTDNDLYDSVYDPPEVRAQKIKSLSQPKIDMKLLLGKTPGTPLLDSTRVRMLIAQGGPSPIDEEGYVRGLFGDRQFIQPEQRATYNLGRDKFMETIKSSKTQNPTQQTTNIDFENLEKRYSTLQPKTMSEDELSQLNDRIGDAVEKTHKDNETGLTEAERNAFVLEDLDDRKNSLDLAESEFDYHNQRAIGLGQGMEATGISGQFMNSIHPTNLGVGLLAGAATDKISKYTGIDKMPMVPRDIVKGGISGGITEKFASGLTGTAMTPKSLGLNIGAGAAAYLVGDVSDIGIEYGLKKAGASKDVQESLGDIGSGALSGATYGGIVGGPEGAAVGAAVGTVGGAAGYGLKKLGATSKTASEVEKAVDYGFTGAAVGATVGSFIPVVGTGIGAGVGFVAGEIGYGLSKIF